MVVQVFAVSISDIFSQNLRKFPVHSKTTGLRAERKSPVGTWVVP